MIQLKRRTFSEMITYFNQQVFEMDIDHKDKLKILAMITAIYQRYDEDMKSAEPPTVNQWIPCSEKMPEKPYGCLVTVWDEEPMTGQMFESLLPYFVGWDGEQWNDAEGMQCPFEVIAWMPLPEPYKGET